MYKRQTIVTALIFAALLFVAGLSYKIVTGVLAVSIPSAVIPVSYTHLVVTTGSVSSSIVPPREIFICALEKKAVHIVMVHNHPSGRAVPSGEDNTVTARIAEAGKLLGIALSDHIIIGDRTYFSYREAGYLT